MSKSDPESAIFMEDTKLDVERKLKKAYGPPGILKDNPLIDYIHSIVFPKFGKITICRKEEHGGDQTYTSK